MLYFWDTKFDMIFIAWKDFKNLNFVIVTILLFFAGNAEAD